jgi:cytochrome c-type biogenesis protein CcmH/NrfG
MAIMNLREAAKQETRNASLWEQIGDAEKSLNHPDAAKEAYAAALKLQIENSTRKRIRAKMVF